MMPCIEGGRPCEYLGPLDTFTIEATHSDIMCNCLSEIQSIATSSLTIHNCIEAFIIANTLSYIVVLVTVFMCCHSAGRSLSHLLHRWGLSMTNLPVDNLTSAGDNLIIEGIGSNVTISNQTIHLWQITRSYQ